MPPPRVFKDFAEFERDYLRPALRVGQSIEDLVDDDTFECELELDRDPFDEVLDDDEDID
jgi:hypothetical protein